MKALVWFEGGVHREPHFREKAVRLGIALEFDTDQFGGGSSFPGVGFLEYGIHLDRPIPRWLPALRDRLQVPLHLHPLDVNLAGQEPLAVWAGRLRDVVEALSVTALVSDAGFWYLGRPDSTWERPPALGLSGRHCGTRAAQIASACGVPFRVENPPVDWADRPCLWEFLEEVTGHPGVEICLDLCHLRQYFVNVADAPPTLPPTFPWRRVTEIHFGGTVWVEYRGRKCLLDQHLADIDHPQLELFGSVVRARGDAGVPDVCLEMEPRSPQSFIQTADRISSYLRAQTGSC